MVQNITNINWYDKWAAIWEPRLSQMENFCALVEKCQNLIKTVNAIDRTGSWRKSFSDILIDILNALLSLNVGLSQFFGGDFDDLIIAIKSLIDTPSELQLENLDGKLEMFGDKLLVKQLTSPISSELPKIRRRLNFIESQLIALKVKSSRTDRFAIGRLVVPADVRIMKMSIINSIGELVEPVNTSHQYFMSLNIIMISIFEDTVFHLKSITENFQHCQDAIKDIQVNQKRLLGSKIKNKLSWFDKLNQNTNDIRDMLTELFNLRNFVIFAFDCFQEGAESVETENVELENLDDKNIEIGHDRSENDKIEVPSKHVYSQLMFNSKAMTGLFDLFILKLWSTYGENAINVWMKIEALNADLSSEQMEKVENALDDLKKSPYKETSINLKETIIQMKIMTKSFAKQLEKIHSSKQKKLFAKRFLKLNAIHFAIMARYQNDKHIIDTFVKFNSELITSLLSNIGSANSG